MDGLKQVGQLQTTGDDGRQHVIYMYREAATNGEPLLITNDGWEVAPVREGLFRVYGTGLLLRGTLPIAK